MSQHTDNISKKGELEENFKFPAIIKAIDAKDQRATQAIAHQNDEVNTDFEGFLNRTKVETADEKLDLTDAWDDSEPGKKALKTWRDFARVPQATNTFSHTGLFEDPAGFRDEERPPRSPPLSALQARDKASSEYSRNRLTEGDTLIITTRNGNAAIYDPHGFPLDTEYRVHSSKLLSTGSSYFQKALQPIDQARLRRTTAFRTRVLPEGVDFVLDMSPDDENGEVMLHELSCPEGIRCWFRAKSRNDVESYLVMGEEETEYPRRQSRSSISHGTDTSGESSLLSKQLASDSKDASNGGSVNNPPGNSATAATSALQAANDNPPLDYTQVRHRACIERLLQIIEGKHARLDSATKVWTVAMLAGIYGCESAVVDEVTSWVYASTNSCIIEILPEAIFKLAITVKSYMLTRTAFGILVAEEAACMRPDTAPSKRNSITPLGRQRDDFTLGEDHLDMIQKAALTFNEQIMTDVDVLMNRKMLWLQQCNEYQKLKRFREGLTQDSEYRGKDYIEACTILERLDTSLRDYYHGRLMCTYLVIPDPTDLESADRHRGLEHWSSEPRLPFESYYEDLTPQQRFCTRQYWYSLSRFESKSIHNRAIPWNEKDPSDFVFVQESMLVDIADDLNLTMFEFITRHARAAVRLPTNITSLAYFTEGYLAAVSEGQTPTDEQLLAHELSEYQSHYKLHPDSTFFNLDMLVKQAKNHIQSVATKMLSRSDGCHGVVIAEGLNCLTEQQYKFLPLFAGGCDDGSGGVGTDMPPPSSDDWDGIGCHMNSMIGTNTATAGASTVRGDEASSVDFGRQAFEDLALLSPKRGKGKEIAHAPSTADSFSVVGYDDTMSEISFASTFDSEHRAGSTGGVGAASHTRNEALEAVMSDDFMLEDSGDLDDDDNDDLDSDDFEMLDDDNDDGEDTETED